MNELLDQSNKSLQDYLDEKEQVEKEAFKVEDDQAANWALRKISQMKKKIEANNQLAVSEIEKIEEWNKAENEKSQQSIDYFQGLLAEYALKKKENDPDFKTLKLPNGKLTFRKQQPEWKLDDSKVIESLKNAGEDDLIKVTEKPKLAEIKKKFKASKGKAINPDTGEVIEGITVEDRPEKFGVTTE